MNFALKSFFCVLFFLTALFATAQKKPVVVQAPSSDSLKMLSEKMFNAPTDMARYEANDLFIKVLKNDLFNPNSYYFSFDSIKALSVLSSSDSKFKIFTWTLPLKTDCFETFGLMLVFSNKSSTYKVIELNDISSELVNPEKEILKKGQWFGAVYFQLIEKKFKGDKYYSLIGWNGANALIQYKVIDVLMFDRNDDPVFGKLIFRGKGYYGSKRLIFRYGDKVTMKLRYETMTYTVVKTKERKRHNARINTNNDEALRSNRKKVKSKTSTEELIMFDLLVPMRPELEGQYQYYMPLSETANAFYFDEGKWIHKQIKTTDDSTSIKEPVNGLLPN
jgi:hypothetical protein